MSLYIDMKNVTTKYSLIILILLISGVIYGQMTKPTNEIIIDPTTHLADKHAPFDQYFYLVVPVDSSLRETDFREMSAYIGQVKGDNLSIPVNKRNGRPKTEEYNYKLQDFIIIEKTGKSKNNLKILMKPLRPGKWYVFRIRHAVTESDIRILEEVNILLYNHQITLAKAKYEAWVDSKTENNDSFIKFRIRLGMMPFDDYKNFFYTDLYYYYRFLLDDNTIEDANLFECIKSEYKNIENCILECECDNIKGELFQADVKDLLIPLSHLFSIADNDELKNNFQLGLYNTRNLLSRDFCTMDDIQTRVSNYQKSIDDIKNIIAFISLEICNSMNGDNKINLIESLDHLLSRLDSNMKQLIEYRILVKRNLKDNDFLFGTTRAIAGGYVEQIKTAAGNYIIPDFGVLGMISPANGTFYVRPYWGVNISFRAINKHTAFRLIPNKTLWHYLSMTIGLTAGSLDGEKIGDLYKGMSFVNGIGIRPSRFFRISVGYVLYKRDNPNPILTQQITAMPYVSFSVDIDIVDLISKITGKF